MPSALCPDLFVSVLPCVDVHQLCLPCLLHAFSVYSTTHRTLRHWGLCTALVLSPDNCVTAGNLTSVCGVVTQLCSGPVIILAGSLHDLATKDHGQDVYILQAAAGRYLDSGGLDSCNQCLYDCICDGRLVWQHMVG